MKNILLSLISAALLCCAQPQTIGIDVTNPGSAFCTGVLQHSDDWISVNGTGDVQVAQKITCKIFVTSMDLYIVVIKVFEPLTTIVAGQRVFTINVNGESKIIDIARIAGNRQILDVSFVVAAEKTLNITFEAQIRTALWSQIAIQRKMSNIVMNVETVPLFAADSNTIKNYTLAEKPAGSSGLITMLQDGTGLFKANAVAAQINQDLEIKLPQLLDGSKLTLIYWK